MNRDKIMSSMGKKWSSGSEDLALFVEPLASDFASVSEDHANFRPELIRPAPAINPSKGNTKPKGSLRKSFLKRIVFH